MEILKIHSKNMSNISETMIARITRIGFPHMVILLNMHAKFEVRSPTGREGVERSGCPLSRCGWTPRVRCPDGGGHPVSKVHMGWTPRVRCPEGGGHPVSVVQMGVDTPCPLSRGGWTPRVQSPGPHSGHPFPPPHYGFVSC